MEGEEDYVGQLKEVFDDCDSSGLGKLNKQDLVLLCQKLQVEDHTDALVERLIGSSNNKRIGFEEFKDGFIAVLSQCADLLSTDDEVSAGGNSFHDDHAASPKLGDGKKYGRRSRQEDHTGSATPLDFPDFSDAEMDYSAPSPASTPKQKHGNDHRLHTTPVGHGMASLDTNITRVLSPLDNSIADVYEGEGLLNRSSSRGLDKSQSEEVDEVEVLREFWKKHGVGRDGYLSFEELGIICESMGMEKMSDKELEELFDKLDADGDGKVGFDEFVTGLNRETGQDDMPSQSRPPSSQSKKLKSASSLSLFDNERRTQTPSIYSAITGSGYFSCLDPEGSGFAQPDDIVEYWESFGVTHEDILKVLDALEFDYNMRISLQELSSALEQEIINHDTEDVIYHIAVYSLRHELRYIKGLSESHATEKDKLMQEIQAAKRRNEIIIREADERHAAQDRQHEASTRTTEQKYQDQLRLIQSQLEKERELITSNAQVIKQRLESELAKAKEEERKLKQELLYYQTELSSLEKELHANLDKNLIMEKDNERLKRELSSATELSKKLQEETVFQIEEIENQRNQLSNEQQKFNEQKIKELEDENKELRDRTDELTLEMEEVRLAISRRGTKGEGNKDGRGSPLSMYTKGESADLLTSEELHSEVNKLKAKVVELEVLNSEILKLKEQHAEQISQLKKTHDAENTKLQKLHESTITKNENKHKEHIEGIYKQLEDEKLRRETGEADLRKKFETEKAELKAAASHERLELIDRLQEDHMKEISSIRLHLEESNEKEIRKIKDQANQEKQLLESRITKKTAEFDRLFEEGAETLRGKLKKDFNQMVEEQAQNEIEVEKRHLEAMFAKERDELYNLLNKEKQSMEDQFNDRLYELQDQMDDVEENVKAQCEEEFMEQIQVVQEAFNEERRDYEKQISSLKSEIDRLQNKMHNFVSNSEYELLKDQRNQAINTRDDAELEKNKMMLERNNVQRELDKLKRNFEKEKLHFQTEIEQLKRLSTEHSHQKIEKDIPQTTPLPASITTVSNDNSVLQENVNNFEDKNKELTKRLDAANEIIFKLTTDLELTKSQHARELQDLKLSDAKSPASYKKLEEMLLLEQQRSKDLEEALSLRSQQGRKLLQDSEDVHLKTVANLKHEQEEYRSKLLATRQSLTEVTEKLKQQMMKTIKSDELVRDLYIENANLMEALYHTEKREKNAEKDNFTQKVKLESISSAYKNFVPSIMKALVNC